MGPQSVRGDNTHVHAHTLTHTCLPHMCTHTPSSLSHTDVYKSHLVIQDTRMRRKGGGGGGVGHGSEDSSLLSRGCHVSVQNFKEFEHSKFEYSLLGNYEFYIGRLEDRTYFISVFF